jgi:hypothetical protein
VDIPGTAFKGRPLQLPDTTLIFLTTVILSLLLEFSLFYRIIVRGQRQYGKAVPAGLDQSANKKTPQETCRVLLIQKKRTFFGQKAKGEEKPEEELMGKRKSSPRLATTSSIRCCYYTLSTNSVHTIHFYKLFSG